MTTPGGDRKSVLNCGMRETSRSGTTPDATTSAPMYARSPLTTHSKTCVSTRFCSPALGSQYVRNFRLVNDYSGTMIVYCSSEIRM